MTRGRPRKEYECGEVGKYWQGCRCPECRAANSEHNRAYYEKLRCEIAPDRVHGTPYGYGAYGCRCDQCVNAQREYRREYLRKHGYWSGSPDDCNQHGTPGGYTNYRCRCTLCTDAWRVANAQRKQKRMSEVVDGVSPLAKEHGTLNAYGNYGCRCTECRSSWTAAARERKAKARLERIGK